MWLGAALAHHLAMLARWLGRSSAALGLALVLTSSGGAAYGDEARDPARDASALAQFRKRADGYVRMRREAASTVRAPQESASPERIRERERNLAAAIRARRAAAKPGDVFGTARAPILAIVQRDWRERSAKERAALADETPDVPAPEVNAAYPAELQFATFPPELLEALPELPEELEYRFAGPHLILHDVEANLVVDVAPNFLGGSGR